MQTESCAIVIETARRAMSDHAVEKLITNSIHTAFIKYPEGDGGPNLDYNWIAPEQSALIARAILLDLEAGGFQVVKKA
jgi:hypothetical protein